MSTVPSADAKAVVRALEGLSTQLRRAVDAYMTPVVEHAVAEADAPTTAVAPPRIVQWIKSPATESARTALEMLTKPEGCEQHPNAGSVGPYCLACTIVPPPADLKTSLPFPRPAELIEDERPLREHVKADEEQTLRLLRREGLLVLLSCLQRGRPVTEAEAATLRTHVETEIREADTARKERDDLRFSVDMAQGRLNGFQEMHATTVAVDGAIIRDLKARPTCACESVRAELAEAQAAIERVRAYAVELERAGWSQAAIARRVLAALDGTEKPTTDTIESLHAKLDEATATLRRLRAVTKNWEHQALPRSEAHRLLTEVREALAGPHPDAAEQPTGEQR